MHLQRPVRRPGAPRAGWSQERLDAALAVLDGHLVPTALRVVATDNRLLL
ncbi:hypothetical protein AB0I60_21625 [Actinosynnema sp. NPDC050436]